jgi:hypothetical protein
MKPCLTPSQSAKATFYPATGFYGFECRFAGRRPHYQMQIFESLERTAWIDPPQRAHLEQPSGAEESWLLISRAYVPGSGLDRLSA